MISQQLQFCCTFALHFEKKWIFPEEARKGLRRCGDASKVNN